MKKTFAFNISFVYIWVALVGLFKHLSDNVLLFFTFNSLTENRLSLIEQDNVTDSFILKNKECDVHNTGSNQDGLNDEHFNDSIDSGLTTVESSLDESKCSSDNNTTRSRNFDDYVRKISNGNSLDSEDEPWGHFI